MNEREWIQMGLFIGRLMVCTPLLGGFMARVFAGERTLLAGSLAL